MLFLSLSLKHTAYLQVPLDFSVSESTSLAVKERGKNSLSVHNYSQIFPTIPPSLPHPHTKVFCLATWLAKWPNTIRTYTPIFHVHQKRPLWQQQQEKKDFLVGAARAIMWAPLLDETQSMGQLFCTTAQFLHHNLSCIPFVAKPHSLIWHPWACFISGSLDQNPHFKDAAVKMSSSEALLTCHT